MANKEPPKCPPVLDDDRLYPSIVVAVHLGITPRALTNDRTAGRIAYLKRGPRYFFVGHEIHAFIRRMPHGGPVQPQQGAAQ
jgi:hypothetical protein